MTTTVGNVAIDIRANTSNLPGDMDRAKAVVKSGIDTMQGAMDSMRGMLAALGVGLSAGAFAGWIKGAIEAADETSKMSQKLGLATEDVAGLQLAFRQAGVGAEFEQSMGKMAKSAAEGSEAFKAMGINVKESDGTLKSTRVLLGEVADAMAGYEDGTAKIALAQEVFGKSGAQLIPLLNAGAQGLDEYDAMAQKLGLTLSEDTAKSAEKFNDTMDLVGQGLQGVGRQVAAQLLPTLSGLADQFFTTMTSGDKLRGVADFLAGSLKVLYIAGVAIVEVFSTVGKAIGAAGAQIVALANGDFAAFTQISEDLDSDVASGWKDAFKQIEGAWNAAGSASVEAMASTQKAIKSAAPVLKDYEDQTKALKKASDDRAKAEEKERAELLKFMQARAAERKKEEDGIAAYMLSEDQRRNATVKASNDSVAAALAEYENYGKTRSQIAEVTLARLEDKLQAYHAGSENARVVQLEIDNQKKLIAILQRGEARDAAKESADEATKWWQKTSDDIEKGLTGALMKGFGKGKDLWESMRDYISNAAQSWIVKIGVQPVMGAINTIAGSVFGLGSAGANAATPGASGSGGIMNLLNMIGGAAGSGFAAGLGAVFGEVGTMGAMSAGASLIGTGTMAGAGAGVGMMAGAALPWIGGAMMLKSLMDYKITPNGGALIANVGSGGASAVASRSDFIQQGGFLGGGTTKNSSWADADKGTFDYINASIQSVTAGNRAYAEMLGLNANALDDYKAQIEINTTGMDEAAAKAAIDAAVIKFANDQISAAYGDAIQQFAQDGETAVDTFKRLAAIEVTSAALNQFGGIFSAIATSSIEARQSLIGMAGGIDALIKKSQTFVDQYYGDNEKSGMSARAILEQLNAVGIDNANTLQTKDDFRALVESMNVNTEQGRQQLNALLTVAPEFSKVSEYLKTQGGDLGTLAQLAPHITALDTLFADNGKTAAAESVVTAQEATNENIQQTTEAVKDSTTAVVSAIERLKSTMDGVLSRLDGIENNGRLSNAGATFG